ncbi:nuclear transport factor 2 family protein [Amycolatopsis jiangsuensis]|uniref:Ketosteroid isomerase-like protein n=1 Tax=Amycolatopsis jiangsuensis TaxID=1181879 RepID=A0A840IPW0_9PSEU|nr:nuclear transport factor 2 family protein [Amycolatopsis jiangsuensis]MBB4684426.1 ketosteroid isomerase-like protein [Amycolatopsis jiangsuensis]
MTTLIPAPRTAERLVTDLFTVIDERRWDELTDVFAPGCVYERPGYEPLAGLADIEHFYRHIRVISVGRHLVDRVVSDLGSAACWGRFTGEDRSGRSLDEGFADTYLVQDGKIVRRTTYFFRAAI